MMIMPVEQKYLPGLSSSKIKRFAAPYLFMTLMSKTGDYKVKVLAQSVEPDRQALQDESRAKKKHDQASMATKLK